MCIEGELLNFRRIRGKRVDLEGFTGSELHARWADEDSRSWTHRQITLHRAALWVVTLTSYEGGRSRVYDEHARAMAVVEKLKKTPNGRNELVEFRKSETT
ncbi:hypothetical protein [Natronoglycomyces albus]|uniref:Uncharacterized protein n=1 Tax=Natronoglycomyces albus TaxID=2811108 RepID=A0A895XV94_9ACTN|nr:hypothetical protein [Natronoglycomyces albus]QSB06446.1 hypothetical protein JQS30_05970 [Natronoglycomyces albus]